MSRSSPLFRLLSATLLLLLAAWLGWVAFREPAIGDAPLAPVAGEVPTVRGPDPAPEPAPTRSLAGSTRPAAGAIQLRGRVLDPAGRPLPGALVGEVGRDNPARTDEAGRFVVEAEGREPGLTLLVLAAGQAPFWAEQQVATGEPVQDLGDLRLPAAGRLRGRITDPAGRPLAGATASLKLRAGNSWPPVVLGALVSPVAAGPDGSYAFAALPPGRYRVTARAEGTETAQSSTVLVREGEETVVDTLVLGAGLRITGTVVDGPSGLPVEHYAVAVRRLGELSPASNGTMVQQLERHLERLRASVAAAAEPGDRARLAATADAFVRRLERVRGQNASRVPAAVPELGPATGHRGGRFAIDGLGEGLYTVLVRSPEHRLQHVEPLVLRRGGPPVDLRIALQPGSRLTGIVRWKNGGAPVAGASVGLVAVLEGMELEQDNPARRSLYPWVFAPPAPPGLTVFETATDDRGAFAFGGAAPGRYYLTVRHPEAADLDTGVFSPAAAISPLTVELERRARLTGRVLDVPPSLAGAVEVLVLGGHGALRTTPADVDGRYRFDGLQPGSYLVRAYPRGDRDYLRRLLGTIFPLSSAAVDPEKAPHRDLVLTPGEAAVFDPPLDLKATGTVQGTVTVNGQPRSGGRAILRPVPGRAPDAGGLSLRAYYDDFGRFSIAGVPVGEYRLSLSGPSGQELYEEPIEIGEDSLVTVQVDLPAGGLTGRVVATDGSPADQLRGTLWVLPGAEAAPEDLYRYRREHRVHRLRVRNGEFGDEALTPGPAILVLELRGRPPVRRRVVVPRAGSLPLDLQAPARLP